MTHVLTKYNCRECFCSPSSAGISPPKLARSLNACASRAGACYMSQTDAPLAVLGVTSAAGAVGQASAAQYSGRRSNVRRVNDLFATSAASITLRFLIATPRIGSDQFAAVSDEQRRHKDIVFLNITESRFNCAFKFVVWFQHCRQAFSTARYWLVADDDTFIQLGHLASDLHTLPAQGHVMWGLVMWYAAPATRIHLSPATILAHTSSLHGAGIPSTTTFPWSLTTSGAAGSTRTRGLSGRAGGLTSVRLRSKGAGLLAPSGWAGELSTPLSTMDWRLTCRPTLW